MVIGRKEAGVKPPKSSAEDAPVHRGRQHANVPLLTGCVTLPPPVFKRGQQFHLTPQMSRGRILNLIGVLAKVQGGRGRLTTTSNCCFSISVSGLSSVIFIFFPKSVFFCCLPPASQVVSPTRLSCSGGGAGLFVK